MNVIDDVLIGALIILIVARQFRWRKADPKSILTLPSIVLAIGIVLLVQQIGNGEKLTGLGIGVFAGEILLVCVTGSVMGMATHIERNNGELRYKLTSWGILLWAVFVGIRVGSFFLAAHIGAQLLESTAAIMISFGVNRMVSSLVVRQRILRSSLDPSRVVPSDRVN